MHKAVISALGKTPETVSLSTTLSLSTISARAGFTIILAHSRTSQYPVWVAKISSNPGTTEDLTREYKALELLRPWGKELNVPIPLEWEVEGDSTCLIFSGVTGVNGDFTIAAESGFARDARKLEAALAWLRKFRECVPVSRLERETDGPGEDVRQLERDAHKVPELLRLFELLQNSTEHPAPAAAHGDFWGGNLLFDGPVLGIIDWEGLASRNAYHDLLSLFTNCSFVVGKKIDSELSVERFLKLFFSDEPVARYVRKTLAELDSGGKGLRYAFYAFVANSVRIKGGRYRELWYEIVRVLARHGFPEPWSRTLKTEA